ncbi:MAG: transglutaminase-like domain-containing protein [Terrimicrobiaceae bacterium]
MDAVTKLLKDGDPETVRLVREQLLLSGEDNLRDLEELAQDHDADVSRHAHEILETLRHRDVEFDFELFCRFFSDNADIEPAIWHATQALHPDVEIEPCITKIQHWGRQFSLRISQAVSSRERVIALGRFMADTLSFRGNAENYYCERNSILPHVVETRMGIPITLTLIYRMVALRAGMIVDGINLPGHFLARHEDVLFDPFHRGRIMTQQDCELILLRQQLRLKPCHLLPATPRQILTRILANLLYIYDLTGECDRHAKVNCWIKALSQA